MSVTKREFSVLSSDKIHRLAGVIFAPEGEVKGYFHIVHGMTEHMGRYEAFMRDMAEEGWICFGYDNLGHGRTVNSDEELGYIAPKKGWDLLSGDVKVFADAVMSEYGRDDLPYCLMGHSMGSFIVRLAAEKYVHPDRLIVMGTGGPNGAAGIGLVLIELVKLIRGGKRVSKLLYKIIFGNYNKRFESELADAPAPWLTTDKEIRKKYSHDKYCTFKFSSSAIGDLVRVMKYSNRAAWYKKLPKDMPVLLVSGEEDPVGNYGKGIRSVRDKLKKQGIEVKCVLYKGARHEILNDFTYENVKQDIIDFCRS